MYKRFYFESVFVLVFVSVFVFGFVFVFVFVFVLVFVLACNADEIVGRAASGDLEELDVVGELAVHHRLRWQQPLPQVAQAARRERTTSLRTGARGRAALESRPRILSKVVPPPPERELGGVGGDDDGYYLIWEFALIDHLEPCTRTR